MKKVLLLSLAIFALGSNVTVNADEMSDISKEIKVVQKDTKDTLKFMRKQFETLTQLKKENNPEFKEEETNILETLKGLQKKVEENRKTEIKLKLKQEKLKREMKK